MKTSLQTTKAGWTAIIIAVLGLLAEIGINIPALDSGTIIGIAGLLAIVINGVGNLCARDNNVSDQEAGARPELEDKS